MSLMLMIMLMKLRMFMQWQTIGMRAFGRPVISGLSAAYPCVRQAQAVAMCAGRGAGGDAAHPSCSHARGARNTSRA